MLVHVGAVYGQAPKDEQSIRNMLQMQTQDWNKGDIDGFMQSYWKSDSLLFIGKNGVTRG